MAQSAQTGSIDLGILKNVLDVQTQINDLTAAIREEATAINQVYASQVNYIKDQVKNFVTHKRDIMSTLETSTKIKHLQEDILTINDKLGTSYVKQSKVAELQKNQDTRRLELEAQRKQAQDAVDAAKILGIRKIKTEAKAYLETVEQAIIANEAVGIELDKINNKLPEANKQATEFTNKTKLISNIMRSIGKIPIIGPLLDADRLADAFLQSKKEGFKQLGNQIGALLKSPAALSLAALGAIGMMINLLKKGIQAVLELDTNLTAVSNSLGVSIESTRLLVNDFYNTNKPVGDLVDTLDDIFITSANISKATLSLQDAFGTSAILSREMVQSQIFLTDQLGLSVEEAAGIQKNYFLTGVKTKEVLDTITKSNRASLSYRKIIGEVAKVNSEIATSYKNQVGSIVNAVIQAQKLGMTLDDTRKISDSLLNFESSIENELKAELLLGKQLNYEKARSLALEGKSAEAAALLVEQTGGLNALTNLNVIQRRALAESIGLSAEELTKFAQQEQIVKSAGIESVDRARQLYDEYKKLGKEKEAQQLLDDISKQQNGELVAQDIARVSINQRFEQTMLKIKDILSRMLEGPLIGMLEAFANFISDTDRLNNFLSTTLMFAKAITASLMAAAVAVTVATGGLNTLAAFAATGVGSYFLMSLATPDLDQYKSDNVKDMKDGVIAPNGQIMISTPEGDMIRTGKNDYLYATPTPPNQLLGGGRGNDTAGNSEALRLLRQLVDETRAGKSIYMNSIKLTDAINRSDISFA